jgi:hypothetical protein
MKALAIASLVATGACTIKTPGTLRELVARREHVRDHQILFGVGLAAGLVVTVVGVALAAHGVELQGREMTADDEAGIPSLLGGFLLTSTGGLAAIGSGIGLGVSTHERSKIDEQIRSLSP